MNQMDVSEILSDLRKHAAHNGALLTSVISIEECSELQKELTKILRSDSGGDKTKLTEEMVDVYICILMLQFTYGISNVEFETMFRKKLERVLRKEGSDCSNITLC